MINLIEGAWSAVETSIRFRKDDTGEVATNHWQAVFYSSGRAAGRNKPSAEVFQWMDEDYSTYREGVWVKTCSHFEHFGRFEQAVVRLDLFGLVWKLSVETWTKQPDQPEQEGVFPRGPAAYRQQHFVKVHMILG